MRRDADRPSLFSQPAGDPCRCVGNPLHVGAIVVLRERKAEDQRHQLVLDAVVEVARHATALLGGAGEPRPGKLPLFDATA
jgi:hypothetical protein